MWSLKVRMAVSVSLKKEIVSFLWPLQRWQLRKTLDIRKAKQVVRYLLWKQVWHLSNLRQMSIPACDALFLPWTGFCQHFFGQNSDRFLLLKAPTIYHTFPNHFCYLSSTFLFGPQIAIRIVNLALKTIESFINNSETKRADCHWRAAHKTYLELILTLNQSNLSIKPCLKQSNVRMSFL